MKMSLVFYKGENIRQIIYSNTTVEKLQIYICGLDVMVHVTVAG